MLTVFSLSHIYIYIKNSKRVSIITDVDPKGLHEINIMIHYA
jgi:hypothetical protein